MSLELEPLRIETEAEIKARAETEAKEKLNFNKQLASRPNVNPKAGTLSNRIRNARIDQALKTSMQEEQNRIDIISANPPSGTTDPVKILPPPLPLASSILSAEQAANVAQNIEKQRIAATVHPTAPTAPSNAAHAITEASIASILKGNPKDESPYNEPPPYATRPLPEIPERLKSADDAAYNAAHPTADAIATTDKEAQNKIARKIAMAIIVILIMAGIITIGVVFGK